MSKLFSFIIFTLALLGLVFASTTPDIAKRDVTQVLSDITSVSSAISTLESSISTFQTGGGTLEQALGIHNAVTGLQSAVSQGSTDTNAAAVFPALDGLTVLTALTPALAALVETLTLIIGTLTGLQSLPLSCFPSLILSDLQALQDSVNDLTAALNLKIPLNLVSLLESLLNPVLPALESAISAFQG